MIGKRAGLGASTEQDPLRRANPPGSQGLGGARRAEADRAIAASEERGGRKKRVAERQQHVQCAQRAGANPMVLILAFLVVLAILALFTWFFIQRVECDPMITDRGYSQECRRAPH